MTFDLYTDDGPTPEDGMTEHDWAELCRKRGWL
jgi:hypothetical protein